MNLYQSNLELTTYQLQKMLPDGMTLQQCKAFGMDGPKTVFHLEYKNYYHEFEFVANQYDSIQSNFKDLGILVEKSIKYLLERSDPYLGYIFL